MRKVIIELDAFPENRLAVMHLSGETATKVGPGIYRKRVLRYGKWNHKAAPGGVLAVDEAYGKKLVANFVDRVFDTVKTVKGHPSNDAEAMALAAGDVLALDDAGGPDGPGVYATVKLDPDVAAAIDSGAIVGCSAGIIPDYTDHEIGGKGHVGPVLEHLALTNTPYIKGLGSFSPAHLAENREAVLLSAHTDPAVEEIMDAAELRIKAKELGIDIDALEAEAGKVAGLEAERDAALAKVTPAPKVDPAPGTEPSADVVAATAAAKGELVTALSAGFSDAGLITLAEGQTSDLGTLVKAIAVGLAEGKNTAAKLALSEAEADVDAAIKEGKAVPAQRDALIKVRLSDEDTFKSLIPAQPLVQLGELGTTGATDPGTVVLSDGTKADEEVTRLLALAENL